jgi:copper chaperone CopZ
MRETFQVPEINCQNCVRHITMELVNIPGVREVAVDLTGKTVTVEHDGTVTDEQMREGIESAGYEVAAEAR